LKESRKEVIELNKQKSVLAATNNSLDQKVKENTVEIVGYRKDIKSLNKDILKSSSEAVEFKTKYESIVNADS